mmetsp:Transcript_46820/g.117990  ORF Transcript_46820/g.117990 Transcript_46820/m.117990 type:complete len:230 (-) Transcript_46820:518-1207(-)
MCAACNCCCCSWCSMWSFLRSVSIVSSRRARTSSWCSTSWCDDAMLPSVSRSLNSWNWMACLALNFSSSSAKIFWKSALAYCLDLRLASLRCFMSFFSAARSRFWLDLNSLVANVVSCVEIFCCWSTSICCCSTSCALPRSSRSFFCLSSISCTATRWSSSILCTAFRLLWMSSRRVFRPRQRSSACAVLAWICCWCCRCCCWIFSVCSRCSFSNCCLMVSSWSSTCTL